MVYGIKSSLLVHLLQALLVVFISNCIHVHLIRTTAILVISQISSLLYFFPQLNPAKIVISVARLTKMVPSSSRTAVNCAPVRTASMRARRCVRRRSGCRLPAGCAEMHSWSRSAIDAVENGCVHTRTIYHVRKTTSPTPVGRIINASHIGAEPI